MKRLPLSLKIALPLTLMGLGVSLFGYAAVHQNYRQSANDPQIQLAQDAWGALTKTGQTPDQVVAGPKVDTGYSLAPFTIVYNADQKPVATNGQFSTSEIPAPPSGSFDYAKQHGPDHFTWEPSFGGRYATTLQYYAGDHGSGYVLVARNLYFVEQREYQLAQLLALAVAGVLLVGFVTLITVKS